MFALAMLSPPASRSDEMNLAVALQATESC